MSAAEQRMLWAAVALGTLGPMLAAIVWNVIL